MSNIHTKEDKNSLLNKYIIALIPLLLFSIYKNGISLYINDLVKFKSILIPIYFYGASLLISYIISLIFKENKKENIVMSLIIASTISINTSLILYPILLFVILYIIKYLNKLYNLKINFISISHILLLLSLFINSYSYLNIAEKLNKFNYNLFDVFLGFSSGGIGTTSLLCLIISLIILLTSKYYKKIIPIITSSIYFLITLFFIIITKNSNYELIINGTVYFYFIFVAPEFYSTPYSKKGMIVYSIIIGVLTSILSLILNIYESASISILIVSIFTPFINKICFKKSF